MSDFHVIGANLENTLRHTEAGGKTQLSQLLL